MNPDVFITIAFAGFVLLLGLVSILIVVPRVRREDADVQQSESRGAGRADDSAPATIPPLAERSIPKPQLADTGARRSRQARRPP
jgi:hypothetical protein